MTGGISELFNLDCTFDLKSFHLKYSIIHILDITDGYFMFSLKQDLPLCNLANFVYVYTAILVWNFFVWKFQRHLYYFIIDLALGGSRNKSCNVSYPDHNCMGSYTTNNKVVCHVWLHNTNKFLFVFLQWYCCSIFYWVM